MELELVSIKDSSEGCRGNGQQEWRYCLIIQMGYDYHSRSPLELEAQLTGHCDYKQDAL